ncbi:hypothetical protein [Candidatus Leptofilum sp.]|uniref:hypothetical protein n=1 Tax=Candidatus Leptofilum sp. TaxID=3241576 RepID=UPI003B58DCF0
MGKTKKKFILLTLVGFFVALFVYRSFQPISTLPLDDQCIASFDTFAFTFPDRYGPTQEVILPLHPWEAITTLPEVEDLPAGRVSGKLEVETVRHNNGNREIWVSNPRSDKGFVYLVYFEGAKEWLQIQMEFKGWFYPEESLHISRENSVWKIRIFDGQILLFVFDDDSKRFIEQQVVTIPPEWRLKTKSLRRNVFDNIQTLWDENDTLWIFSSNDAVYNFDPATQQLNRLASLEGYATFSDLASDFKNEVFFDAYDDQTVSGTVLQYNISTNELAEVSLSKMPGSSVSLVDLNGNFWLGNSYGYRTPEGNWKRLNPNPINFWWHMDFLDDWRYYVPPTPVQQTSDGRIWFVINRSQEWNTLRSGIAWFDPNTEEGCWFTSEGAQIVEDSQQNLWVVIENTLYRYENETLAQ